MTLVEAADSFFALYAEQEWFDQLYVHEKKEQICVILRKKGYVMRLREQFPPTYEGYKLVFIYSAPELYKNLPPKA